MSHRMTRPREGSMIFYRLLIRGSELIYKERDFSREEFFFFPLIIPINLLYLYTRDLISITIIKYNSLFIFIRFSPELLSSILVPEKVESLILFHCLISWIGKRDQALSFYLGR